uniref:Methylthioribose-1-phosphate isomerase-like n=1 Tax=Ciona intestinalis TaxID=7719 RepID=F6ZGV0_CIOIN|nr:methylthioribose-1-phosphate isomerase-like [Ciona intestinalis]|eukprot:XP_002126254.2 methylthioribose-1-phosphate isomerase-like [Ciona intestinalis]
MKVRGAPMIAIVGCLSVAVELRKENFDGIERFREFMNEKLSYLTTARPTAVNMSKSAKDLVKLVDNLIEEKHLLEKMKSRVLETIEQMLHDDITDNKQLSEFGAKHILSNSQSDKITILTHCNTGSLATAGYGTALGVVRALHETSNLEIAYCTETRPYNQGARLTAYEFVHDNIPSTLICDSMVGLLMDTKEVSG